MRRVLARVVCSRILNGDPPALVHTVPPVLRNLALNGTIASRRGFLGHEQPKAWTAIGGQAIERCEELVQQVHLSQPGREVLHLIDEVSDVVCHAVDAANFCRLAHSDPKWRQAATDTAVQLHDYVAKLNTDARLYNALKVTFDGLVGQPPAQVQQAGWTAEELLVGRSFLREFVQSGMALKERDQAEYRKLKGLEQRLCLQLSQAEMERKEKRSTVVALPGDVVEEYKLQRGSAPAAFRSERRAGGLQPAILPQDVAEHLAWRLPHSLDRLPVYRAVHALPDEMLGHMVDIMHVRKAVAAITACVSFGSYALRDASLAQAPEAVAAFLRSSQSAWAHSAADDVRALGAWAATAGRHEGPLGAWDVSHLQAAMLWERERGQARSVLLSTRSALKGLFEIVQATMGVRFEQRSMGPSEAWAPDIQKLAAVHATRGELGIIYLDLFDRPRKQTGNAQFTLRCGRSLPNGEYRTPLVALALNLPGRGANISYTQVRTLFHEFGHALNSMVCDNKMQHMFGTRGPLDIVELPAHILERFSLHTAVLDKMLQDSGHDDRQRKIKSIQFVDAFCSGIQAQQSLVLPLFDCAAHGPAPPASVAAVADVYHAISSDALPYEVPRGTFEHLSINHFVNYASFTHAYPYADAIADAIWQRHFASDPYNARAGALVCETLLRPGAAVDVLAAVNAIVPGLLKNEGGAIAPRVSSVDACAKLAH